MVAQPKVNASKPAKGGPHGERRSQDGGAGGGGATARDGGWGRGRNGGDELQHRLSSLALETAYFKRFRANVRKGWEGKMVF